MLFPAKLSQHSYLQQSYSAKAANLVAEGPEHERGFPCHMEIAPQTLLAAAHEASVRKCLRTADVCCGVYAKMYAGG